ncbi:MAG: site-specific integrase, partial [Flavobacteriales bacterium]|nr:site-specific integrase [Flavobacteriales bacterium]
MATLNYYLEKRKNKHTGEIQIKNVPIILHFNFEGKRLQYYTGERIDSSNWIDKKLAKDGTSMKVQKVKPSVSGSLEINLRLEKLAEDVKRIYREAHIQGIVPTVQHIRETLPVNQKSSNLPFFDVLDRFIQSKKTTSTSGTITKFNVIKKHLEQFSSKKKIRIEFDSIDKRLLQRFADYQLHDCGHTNNTVAKTINIIKWFLNWATDEEYNKNLKYKGFTMKERYGKIIVLSWEELQHLYQMKLKNEALKQVRDVFCFQCFTGLRYSDVRMLKKHNIKDGYINITTVKTKEENKIPLNDYATAIIEKYEGYPGDFLLPVISNQNMNDHLKKLGKKAGFNERIEIVRFRGAERIVTTVYKYEVLTTHIGRKTFTTNNGR